MSSRRKSAECDPSALNQTGTLPCGIRIPRLEYLMPREKSLPDGKTQYYYDSHAAGIFALYNSIESPFTELFDEIFPPGGKILDIGCGSGRDLTALRNLGYKAFGIESSPKMLDQIKEQKPELKNYTARGFLPEGIPEHYSIPGSWDGLVCSAVLQHIRDSLLPSAASTLSSLIKPRGRLILTIPGTYPLNKKNRDVKERLCRIRPAEEISRLFENNRFSLLDKRENPDSLNRKGISWITLIFQKED